MVDKEIKKPCPTCGQPMSFKKSDKEPKKLIEIKNDKDMEGEVFDISQIWHCLNCSEEWKLDIINNIWRKYEITE
jgi:hypothetical protein